MPLTDQEHRAMADEMAQLVSEKDALKATRKTVNADFRNQMQEIDARLLELAEAMSRGENVPGPENRPGRCGCGGPDARGYHGDNCKAWPEAWSKGEKA